MLPMSPEYQVPNIGFSVQVRIEKTYTDSIKSSVHIDTLDKIFRGAYVYIKRG